MFDSILWLDAWLFLRLSELAHPDWLTSVMKNVSAAGGGAAIWLVLSLLLAVWNSPPAAFRVVLALLFTYAVVELAVKPIVARDRPPVTYPEIVVASQVPDTWSFPSGHASVAAAGAFGLSRVWSTAAPAVWTVAVAISISRIYLGVHYVSDVVMGMLLGLACAYFVTGGKIYRSRES